MRRAIISAVVGFVLGATVASFGQQASRSRTLYLKNPNVFTPNQQRVLEDLVSQQNAINQELRDVIEKIEKRQAE